MGLNGAERQARYRAKLAGKKIEPLKRGPREGFKQSKEHIEKRKRFGPEHPNWKGDDVSVKGGRTRALRKYEAKSCSKCKAKKAERHHINEDTSNNEPSNIAILCRKCHMAAHRDKTLLRG